MDAIQAYRESGLTADDPVYLIVLLHDQLLRDLHRALDAFEKQDVPRRSNEIDHALLVLGQLQGTLNLESGGEVALNLETFYNLTRDNSAACCRGRIASIAGKAVTAYCRFA